MSSDPKQYLTNATLLLLLQESHTVGYCTDDLASAFMLMSRRYATKPNFSGYSYVQDMIAAGAANCCIHWHKFDMTRPHPFSYFTTVLYNSFIAVMRDEKEQQDIKNALSIDAGIGERGWKTEATDHS